DAVGRRGGRSGDRPCRAGVGGWVGDVEGLRQRQERLHGGGDEGIAEGRAGSGRGVLTDLDELGGLGQVLTRLPLVVAEDRGADDQGEVVGPEDLADRGDAGGQDSAEVRVLVGKRQTRQRRGGPDGQVEGLGQGDRGVPDAFV